MPGAVWAFVGRAKSGTGLIGLDERPCGLVVSQKDLGVGIVAFSRGRTVVERFNPIMEGFQICALTGVVGKGSELNNVG